VSADRAAGARETYPGVVVGLVTDNEDPEGLGRVRVTFPWRGTEDENESFWAPVAVPMAGAEYGTYFLPEVDDEVLVAFENGDLQYPYVVGALWSADRAPPESNDGNNDVRTVRSRSGHAVTFDDGDDGAVEVTTAGGNSITLEDASGSERITVADSGGNSVELDAANGTVTVSGATKVVLSGTMLELTADGNIDIEASGVLNLKGALVNIN